MATHSSILAWKIPWMEEPGVLQFMGSQRVGHDWANSATHSLTQAWWQYRARIYSFPNFEPVHYSMSVSNCCILTYIQVYWEAGKVVWYSHIFKNFPEFVVVHSQRLSHSQWSKSRCLFGISLAFSIIQQMLAIWSLIPLPFLNPACTSRSSWFTYWSLVWRSLSITWLVWTEVQNRTEMARFLIWFLIFRSKTEVSLNSANILSVC